MAIISPNPAMQDLKVTYQESTLVFPSQHTAKKTSLFLSNIDQFLNINVPTLLFFSANTDFSPQIVAKRLKMALEKVLVMYEFMAGRLKWDPHESGRLEIDCSGAGAGFVVACSEFLIDEIGDLVCPNLGFRQLAVQSLPNSGDDQPLCILQVTSFKCGGFAIGMSLNHILFDGVAGKAFLENLASQTFDNKSPPFIIPSHNRRLLPARSPPLISFPHTEFFKPDLSLLDILNKQQLDFIILKLTSSHITFLKAKANNTKIATTFNVVAGLIWRCMALSSSPDNKDRASTLLNAVSVRSRVNPPLPPEYCGNAVLFARASARCGDMEKWRFQKMVEMVAEGIARVTDEYVRSSIDWLEINKGIPCGDIIVTSWLRLGFDEAVFPWGKAVSFVPVVNNLKSLCWVFSGGDGGVNVLVQRPAEEIERFQSHFRSFFENNPY